MFYHVGSGVNKSKGLTYAEVFMYGKDKEVYEVVESPVYAYNGDKVVLKESDRHSGSIVMKREGTYHSDDSSTLVTPYGAITGARFKLVDQYEEITLGSALDRLEDNEVVFVADKHGTYSSVGKFTDLDEIEVADFDDLLERKFYIKK